MRFEWKATFFTSRLLNYRVRAFFLSPRWNSIRGRATHERTDERVGRTRGNHLINNFLRWNGLCACNGNRALVTDRMTVRLAFLFIIFAAVFTIWITLYSSGLENYLPSFASPLIRWTACIRTLHWIALDRVWSTNDVRRICLAVFSSYYGVMPDLTQRDTLFLCARDKKRKNRIGAERAERAESWRGGGEHKYNELKSHIFYKRNVKSPKWKYSSLAFALYCVVSLCWKIGEINAAQKLRKTFFLLGFVTRKIRVVRVADKRNMIMDWEKTEFIS